LIGALAGSLGRRGFTVFWDRAALRGGEPLMETIENAIANSHIGVVFLSERSVKSGFVELEAEEMGKRERSRLLDSVVVELQEGCTIPQSIRPKAVIFAEQPWDLQSLTERIAQTARAFLRRRSRF
jgi:hypothetical protein